MYEREYELWCVRVMVSVTGNGKEEGKVGEKNEPGD